LIVNDELEWKNPSCRKDEYPSLFLKWNTHFNVVVPLSLSIIFLDSLNLVSVHRGIPYVQNILGFVEKAPVA